MARTQKQRREAMRVALLEAGRELFGSFGYADVSTDALSRKAGATRGALYHHFGGKLDLFAAVVDDLERDMAEQTAAGVLAASPGSAREAVDCALEAWLDACSDPAVQQILLIDGPAVLGWQRWKEIDARHGIPLVKGVLEWATQEGIAADVPFEPLAHVIEASIRSATLYIAAQDDPVAARAEMSHVFAFLNSIFGSPPK